MKLIGYCRVSTSMQEDNTSLADQEERLRQYCKALGHELVDVYIDVASGKDLKRPQLRRALFNIVKDDIDGVIVTKLDRLSRSVSDLLKLTTEHFQKKNLVILDLNIDTSTPSGRAIFTMMGAMAQLERETIRERTINGIAYKLKNEKWMGGNIPFGSMRVDGELVKDPREQEIISIIIEMRKKGASYRTIAKALNNTNKLRKSGVDWRMCTIRHLFEGKFGDGHTAITFDPDIHTYRKIKAV